MVSANQNVEKNANRPLKNIYKIFSFRNIFNFAKCSIKIIKSHFLSGSYLIIPYRQNTGIKALLGCPFKTSGTSLKKLNCPFQSLQAVTVLAIMVPKPFTFFLYHECISQQERRYAHSTVNNAFHIPDVVGAVVVASSCSALS